MKVLKPEDLLRRLSHDVLLSTVDPRDLPERQQTMNATVAWSYKLLDPDEQGWSDLRKPNAEREVRARLGPDRWARAYAAGRKSSIDALLKDIDSVV